MFDLTYHHAQQWTSTNLDRSRAAAERYQTLQAVTALRRPQPPAGRRGPGYSLLTGRVR